jgi:outer membrane protein assembly complex protein YaeT
VSPPKDQPPSPDGTSAERPLRSKLRLALRVLAGVALALAVVVLVGLVFLHSPAGRSTARVVLERWASQATGGALRLGQLELALWRGHAAAVAVSFEVPGTRVDVQRVSLDWPLGTRPQLLLVRPQVVVTDIGAPRVPGPAIGLAARPWLGLERLRRVEIVDGRVELRDAKAAPWLVLSDLDAWSTDAGERVTLRLGQADLGSPGGGLRLLGATAEGAFGVRDGRLQVERARIASGDSSLELAGALERIQPLTASLSGRAAVDGALVEAVAPGTDLKGRLEAETTLDAKDDRFTGTLTASSSGLTLSGLGPWSTSARGRLEPGAFVVESFTALGYGGRIEASGPLALTASGRTEVELRATGFDPLALARAFQRGDAPAQSLPVSTVASATLRISTHGFDLEKARGTGQLSLQPGAGAGLKPTGGAGIRIEGRTIAIAGAHVEARGARLTADGELRGGGSFDGRFTAELPLAAVPGLLADTGRPAKAPPMDGRLVAEGEVRGATAAPEASARLRSVGLAVRGNPVALEAEALYQGGRLAVAPLVLRSGRGQATLTGTVPLAPADQWELAGDVDALEIAPGLALAGLEGRGPASGTVRVSGPRDEPVTRVSLRAEAHLARADGAAPGEDDVVLQLDGQGVGNRIELERIEAQLAGGRVGGAARYDAGSGAVTASLEASGLATERLPLVPASSRRLAGTLAGTLVLAGTTAAPEGELTLTLADPRLDGAALPPLGLAVRADGRELRVKGTADTAEVVTGSGRLEGDWPLRLAIDMKALPYAAVVSALPAMRQASAELAGTGSVAVELPLRAPERVRYSSSDLAFSGRLRKLEWRTLPFAVRGGRELVEVSDFKLVAGKSWLTAHGKAALAEPNAFDFDVQGLLDFESAGPALPERTSSGSSAVRAFGGQGTLKLHVGGTLESPQLAGTVALADLRGRVEGARVTDLDAEARFEGRELRIERLQAAVLGGTVTASGALPLVAKGGAASRLAFELKDVDLAQFLERELRESADSPSLLVSLTGELQAESLSPDRLSASGRLTRFDSRSVEGALALAAPVAWSLERGHFDADPIRLEGALGTLEARLGPRGAGARPGGEATVKGAVDLRVLSPFLPDTSVSGPATIDVRANYTGEAFRLFGSVQVEKGRLSLDAFNFAATELAGALRFDGERATLEATAVSGDGRLEAKGGTKLGGGLLGTADLQLSAERVPVNYPAGFRGRASGSLRLSGEPGHYRLTGNVDLGQSFYTADLSTESQSLQRLDWQLAALEGGSISDQIALDVNVRLAEPVRVRNATMHVDMEGALTVSGTLSQPTTEGVVNMREGGELTIGRGRVRVNSGRITLNGYPAGTPDVDLQGATRVSGIAFTLRARGSVDDLQLTLESDRADLSQTDLLTLLVTGRTASAAASQSGVVVAEQLAVALGGVLQKGVGETLVIDVAPDRSLLTEDTDPTQRMHLGTRITQNLTVLYSVALDGTQQRWIVELNPGGGRFRFRAITEEDNTYSFEGSDRFAFDLWNRGKRVGRAAREVVRLGSLRFQGSLPVAEAELRKATKLKPRRRYSGLQHEQAAERVRARLARDGYRSASVDTLARPGKGGVDLVLQVEAGPLVTFTWSGDDPGGKTRDAAEEAFTAYAAPEAAALLVARTALHRLQADGYYAASVEPKTTTAEGRVEVALHVALGPKGTGVAVQFEGNKALAPEALLAQLPRPGSLEFFEALDPRSARISSSLRLAYARIGYLRVRVPSPRSRFDAQSGVLSVTIVVRERSPATVAEIELPEEVRAPDADAPKLALQLRQGAPFDLAAYVADRDAIVAWYRAQGWLEAQAGSTIETRGGDVAVRYKVDTGPRPRIGSVRVVDDGNTRGSLIRHSLKLREGDFLKPAALADSRERLSDIGIYRSVEVRTEPRPPSGDLRDVVVGLVPKPDVQVEYGLRYTTAGNAGATGTSPENANTSKPELQGAFAVELTSPFGYGVKTRAHTFVTTDRTTWGLSFDTATLVGRRVRTQLFLFDDDADDDFLLVGIDSRVRGVTLQQSRVLLRDRRSRRWHDRLRLQWGYTFKDIEYFGTEPGVVQLQGYRGFLSLSAVGDERDSLTDPSRGIFWTATSELARTWLGSDVDYVRLYGQLFGFVPLGPVVWAQGLRVGTVPGENALALIENRFRAGGATTVRGFDQNYLGPKGPEGGSLGGQAVVVLNEELRFPIYKSLKGGLFWDAGNVWAFSRELSFKDLRQSVGFGLRYMFPFGPLRLEYAWVLNPQEGEAKSRFVFGLGHAF